MSPRQILVTSALPYANGQIHLGHLVETIQTDIWVRFQKAIGHRAIYICADDTHGTAIMMRARQEGRSAEELIASVSTEHQRDFTGFGIDFDHYGSTNSAANEKLCGEFWEALHRDNLISVKDVAQLFDADEGMFLADRFVKGECPKCGTPDQYGDSCEKCGATYTATELVNPRSTIGKGAVPEIRSAPHHLVDIDKLHGFLDQWVEKEGVLQSEIRNYLKGFFLNKELKSWDVSRPAPYFGFEIPNAPGNFWYVWFDAPIGYLASTKEWAEKSGEDFNSWWKNEKTEVVHFIGKDITYFHTLFWPCMLKSSGYSLPSKVHVHGFLTVNGEKMSKSRGTFIQASTYLEHLDPAALRYFYASKLSSKVDDIDLDFAEFAAKVNSDLVGKVVNLASRSAKFLGADGLCEVYPADDGLFQSASLASQEIAEAFDKLEFAQATRLIMGLADRANEYVDRVQPWTLKKDPAKAAELREVVTICLNLFRQLVVFLNPIIPTLTRDVEAWLGESCSSWSDASAPLKGDALGSFSHLMKRIEPSNIQKVVDASKSAEVEAPVAAEEFVDTWADDGASIEKEPLAELCTIDDFTKIDLRIARIVEASEIPEAKKLLRLKVSLGGGVYKQIFAGIKAAFEAEKLIGKTVVIVANLTPRKMKFGMSEGMIIAAGEGGSDLFLCEPFEGAKVGQRFH